MPKNLLKTKRLSQYRRSLEEKARQLRRSMSTPVAAEFVTRSEEPNDTADLARQSHDEWVFLNQNARYSNLMRQVEEALERIEDGTYKHCAACAQPIPPKRLEAVPWAKYCVPCQENQGPRNN